MSTQFLRRAELIVANDFDSLSFLPPLRFTFKIQQSDFSTPNTAKFVIFNLSAATEDKIKKEYTDVILQAGYQDGNFGIIFAGQIRQIRSGRVDPKTTHLTILAQDGDTASNYAVVNQTLAPQASGPVDQLNAIMKAMGEKGVTQGYTAGVPSTGGVLPRGKVLYGMAPDKLNDLARTNNSTWSIQNGKLQLVPKSSYIPGTVIKLNARSGMVGMPTQTDNGIEVRALLNPMFKVGSLVQLNNKDIQRAEFNQAYSAAAWNNLLATVLDDDGYYRIYVVECEGDTRGTEWYSDLITLAASGAPAQTDGIDWYNGNG